MKANESALIQDCMLFDCGQPVNDKPGQTENDKTSEKFDEITLSKYFPVNSGIMNCFKITNNCAIVLTSL